MSQKSKRIQDPGRSLMRREDPGSEEEEPKDAEDDEPEVEKDPGSEIESTQDEGNDEADKEPEPEEQRNDGVDNEPEPEEALMEIKPHVRGATGTGRSLREMLLARARH